MIWEASRRKALSLSLIDASKAVAVAAVLPIIGITAVRWYTGRGGGTDWWFEGTVAVAGFVLVFFMRYEMLWWTNPRRAEVTEDGIVFKGAHTAHYELRWNNVTRAIRHTGRAASWRLKDTNHMDVSFVADAYDDSTWLLIDGVISANVPKGLTQAKRTIWDRMLRKPGPGETHPR